MENETYNILRVNGYIFEFESVGIRRIEKQVSFDEIRYQTYNLSLGTVLEDGTVDFHGSDNNGDTIKFFATTIECIKRFTKTFPERLIFFRGIQNKRPECIMKY